MALRRDYDKILPVHEAVGAYTDRVLNLEDAALREVKQAAQQRGTPSITPEAGRTLQLLATLAQARNILELGTGTGYSGIWLARGLPVEGRLITVEGDPKTADLARRHFDRAGVGHQVHVQIGSCLEAIQAFPPSSMDFVFVDATKHEYPAYLEAAERVLRSGGLLAADNVYWQGSVLTHDPVREDLGLVREVELRGILEFTRRITKPPWQTMIFPFGDGLSVSRKA